MLPAFPRTPHLPHNPNAESDDIIATNVEVRPLFTKLVNIEEKIDGASVGITSFEGNPVIRNREHVLNKAYSKNTAAKKQFASIWNWFYKNKDKFKRLASMGPYSVYGEWCIAQHGIFYNKLPDWFIAYDIYNYEQDKFISPVLARVWLNDLGFSTAPLIFQGQFIDGYDELAAWAKLPSKFSDSDSEGIYLKIYDDEQVLNRFKMVQPNFERGKFWNPKAYTKNELA